MFTGKEEKKTKEHILIIIEKQVVEQTNKNRTRYLTFHFKPNVLKGFLYIKNDVSSANIIV